jgi:hypothetical protein
LFWRRRSAFSISNCSAVRYAPPPPLPPGGGGAKRTAEQLEIENADLRRQNNYLRQQRDILKKTLGILSEPPSNDFNGLTR